MQMDLNSIEQCEKALNIIKNSMQNNFNGIETSLEDVKNNIDSTELNSKIEMFEENTKSISKDLIKSMDNIITFINHQNNNYNTINEDAKTSLKELIEMLNSIENPLKRYLKEEENI